MRNFQLVKTLIRKKVELENVLHFVEYISRFSSNTIDTDPQYSSVLAPVMKYRSLVFPLGAAKITI